MKEKPATLRKLDSIEAVRSANAIGAAVIRPRGKSWISVALQREAVLPAILVVVATFLALYNLEYYPRTWFDEGSHLQVPKMLVLYGQYADYSSEGFRHDGPSTGAAAGPTVLLPIALAFKVFGIGLLQARLVMAAYLLLTLLLYYSLAGYLFGRVVAFVSTFLLLASPGIGFLEFGRQVLGEVPALGFFIAGTLLWFSALDARRLSRLVLSGLALGLAMVTKSYYVVMLPPALILLWSVDSFHLRQLQQRQLVIPLIIAAGVFGTWYGYQFIYLGASGFLASADRIRAASTGAIFAFSLDRIPSAIKFILSPDVLYGWAVPGLIYGLLRGLDRKNPTAIKQAFLSIFVLVWSGWYALASIGWPRYAFPALAIATIFAAKLLADLAQGFDVSLRDIGTWIEGNGRRLRALCVSLAIVLMVLYPLQQVVQSIVAEPDRTPQEFARLLEARVPQDAVVETWEPELGFLTNHRYHYPPISLLDQAVRQIWLNKTAAITYDSYAADAEYLVLGRFGKWTGVYASLLAGGGFSLVGSVGEYDLYESVRVR